MLAATEPTYRKRGSINEPPIRAKPIHIFRYGSNPEGIRDTLLPARDGARVPVIQFVYRLILRLPGNSAQERTSDPAQQLFSSNEDNFPLYKRTLPQLC